MNILTVLNKAKALELADFLDDLSVNGPSSYEGEGISGHVCSMLLDAREVGSDLWLREAFRLWPKYSGDRWYPVPHKKGAKGAFYSFHLWDKRTQYGKDRRELCIFLANLIRSQCNG